MSAKMTEIVSEAATYLDAIDAIESVSYSTMAKVIDARDEAVELSRKAAEAIGSKPDYDDYDDAPQWAAALTAWHTAVDRLHPTDKTAKLAEDPLSCGDPGHDYTDHIVEYEGKAILDTQLPEGAKGTPITGPGWTEVDPAQWSDEYKHKQRMHKAAQN